MSSAQQCDWNPADQFVLNDQTKAYDNMRNTCPVAYSDQLGWSLFKHADIVNVLNDPVTFQNKVSKHLSVPNGMDPPKHTKYRRVIEPFFACNVMEELLSRTSNIQIAENRSPVNSIYPVNGFAILPLQLKSKRG